MVNKTLHASAPVSVQQTWRMSATKETENTAACMQVHAKSAENIRSYIATSA